MPCGPLIHGAPAALVVLRHMRGDVHPAEFFHEFLELYVDGYVVNQALLN